MIDFSWDDAKCELIILKMKIDSSSLDSPPSRLLIVCHCYRDNDEQIRMISAKSH